jgi:iron complex transport system substrate-binding protein
MDVKVRLTTNFIASLRGAWAAALILCGACLHTAHAHAAITVTDDAGTPITLPQAAQRIITLAPNLTELAFAAGGANKIVAVTRYSDHPAQARTLPQMGDAFALNLEAIARAKPDLIVVWLSGTPQRQRDALKKLGVPVFESEIHDVQGIARTLTQMGQLMGTRAVADAAAQALLADWQKLSDERAQALGTAQHQRLRVFYQVWDKPLMTFNGQHLVSRVIRLCGGEQGFDALTSLTPTVSREAVLAYDPQLILSGDPKGLHIWKSFERLSATAHGQLQAANAALLTRMSPRIVLAARELCGQLDAAKNAYKSVGNQRP